MPYVFHGFREGMRQGRDGTQKRAEEDEFDAVVQSRLRRKTLFHAALAVGTTKEALEELLSEAIKEGQSVQQLAKNIDEYFKLQSRKRSLVIARTELTDTINDGTLHVIQREGYAQKEWITNLDGRERESHREVHGQVVGINDVFKVGVSIARHPGDDNLPPNERIQCRCRLVAAGLPDDRKAASLRAFLRTHGSLERTLMVRLQQEFSRQRRRILSHFPSH